MSDKIFLKDITFPILETGENETYSFVQTDADLDTAGDAADAKAVGDELTNLKQDLEGLDVYTLGLYPQMSVEDTAVASFTDGADDIPVKSLTVDITPVQSGTGDPSPENVRPISGWTGANVTRTGKNLFGKVEYGKYIVNNEVVTRTEAEHWAILFLPIQTGSYQLSITDLAGYKGAISIYTCDADKNIVTLYTTIYANSITLPYTYTVTIPAQSTTRYICMCGYNSTSNGGVAMIGTTAKIQFESGSSATAYEPFGTVYSISFPTEAGTVYGGTLDVTSGVLTVTNGYADMGTLTWTYESGANPSLNYFECGLNPLVKNGTTNLICSKYPIGNVSYASGDDHAIMATASANHVRVRDTSYTDAATFKTAMSGVQLVYELATPQTYQLNPREVTTLLKNNNLFADTGNVAELTYRADLKTYIDEKLA